MTQLPVQVMAFADWDVVRLRSTMLLWLKENPLYLGHFIFQYQAVVLDHGGNQSRAVVEHSVIVFYEPAQQP